MYLLPAIDLLSGKVVRLARGDYDAATVYHDDPVAQARSFAEQGATWIHIVDLDGARTGVPAHGAVIQEIIAQTSLNIEVGGGVRSFAAIASLMEAGARRVVLGTKLITDPAFACEAVARYGEAICAGVDARDGEVAIEGWRAGAGVSTESLVGEIASWGIRHLVYTDISRDGMQTGIDDQMYEKLAGIAGFPVIASGGISSLDDLRVLALLPPGCIEGVIVGRALYEASFTVVEAIAVLESAKAGPERTKGAL